MQSFTAKVINTKLHSDGIAVELDQTAFYPTSGGQPFDTGTLDGEPILDVWEEDGIVWHLMNNPPQQIKVKCEIDWPRRFDHMQQHSGQHILSAIFLEQCGWNTIGFHLGEELTTIDLDCDSLPNERLSEIESIANKFIWENHPVSIQFITDDQMANVSFRKKPKVQGTIRVIKIGDLDISACGGTHVDRTGEIGLLKITGCERYKGGTRISFLCGQRAFNDYQRLHDNTRIVSQSLSIHPEDLPDIVSKIKDESASNLHQYRKARKELAKFQAEQLWIQTPLIKGNKVVFHHWIDLEFEDLRGITNQLREKPHTIILLASTELEKIRLICSRSEDLVGVSSKLIMDKTLELMGGKGGGTSEIAQGGAPKMDSDVVINCLKKALSDYL